MGHRHDWEGVTVVWQRDAEGDWWHRAVSNPTKFLSIATGTKLAEGRHIQRA